MTTTTAPCREAVPPAPPPSETRTPKGPDVGDVLQRAAAHIERKGWWSESVPGSATGDCIVLALAHAADCHEDDVDSLCVLVGFDDKDTAVRWNDALGRTQAEVLAALRGAAGRARGETA